ncbi:uncharacterized protein LOC128886008 isoform X1 [Hylaeus anthracinus]|uniref:uncharacterized protein LOC128886008 isoform X1 n=1 Tax=Hylaeus anthracinus TaxID=313031 RepID=UPI0023BA3AA4|nr:uncharacterized protein LOC128886008 isoform X1 [Hylaeus anthracinus]XP_053996472.1 uncharacterized protein LOC128886008 isoform X1 [Hylaeus anthracinus]XP_053996474.1 uncharacterized protein LOC128886008 isoform X1 [Hylaeus anthracinus]XP_053996475.1 uncharacterized protein LOC128886008 isoform X1 [Hylaeus anthracinus]XP_053996476.1 uncharacterized protein LOC128886008 isoform X1 [Hylaeus anthracinus]XP_053996477.1 uncharacterized protein LOC128886008 isoform X1 [Hylaeus anthracinus]
MEDEGSPSAVSGENASKAPESITGWMESTVVTASQTTLGQMLFKLVDSFLWVVEKSTQWSLPAQEINAEENGKVFGKIELVRPLPWILFLPGLVILRIVRVALNAGAFVLRYPRIEPSGMVKFLQKSRRRLRALNIKAIKSARRKMGNKDKRLTMIETEKALIRSIRLTLSSLSCLDTSKSSPSPPPTKIRITGMDLEMVATPDEKSTTESAESPMHTEAKRKFSQVSSDEESSDESDNETLLAKLDRLALEDSTDDPDFDPTNCSTESSTSNSENEVGQNTSVTDVTEVQKELTEIVKDNKEKPTIFPLDKDTCMATTEEMVAGITGVDSSESKLQTISRTTNDFINGEVSSSLPPMPPVSTPPPPPPPPPEVTNGVVSEHKTFNRRSSNAPPAPQQRGVAAKEHAPATQEKKISPRKKPGRKDVK